jgi:hypothetical protein
MKKNAMLKIAAILMVAVLLTTCAISSTFAKYTTAEATSANSTARVAKWGLEIAVTGAQNALFDTTVSNTAIVVNGGGDCVVAPVAEEQTTEALIGVTISGTPEVAYRVYVKPGVSLTGWNTTEGFYCPVTFKFGTGTAVAWEGKDADSDGTKFVKAINEALAEAILGGEAEEETSGEKAGYFYRDFGIGQKAAGNTSLTWDWDFEANDKLDTELGNAAAKGTDSKVSIDFKISAEQIAQLS